MIEGMLGEYRRYLECSYSPETAKKYFIRLRNLLEGQSVSDTVQKLDIDKVLDKLAELKYKNYFSQGKNAFFHFCKFQGISLSMSVMDRISELEKCTKRKYRKMEFAEYEIIKNKIDHIKNKRLRLSYQMMVATGLRVSELSGVTVDKCTVSDDGITFFFIAKGGSLEKVALLKCEYQSLYLNIKELIDKTSPEKRLFFSAVYLQKKAKKLGFKCHDLRRICAKLEYKHSKSKEKVMMKLRHASIKNTNIYLRSRIKI